MPDSIIDPFDPAALRIDQNTEALAVKRVWTTIPVGKPQKHHWFRVHPSEEFRLTKAATIKLEEGIERDIYILAPHIAAAFPEEVSYVALFTVINRQEQIRIWPVRLPEDDGRWNDWSSSAWQAARLHRATGPA
jgi:hypothetical protein